MQLRRLLLTSALLLAACGSSDPGTTPDAGTPDSGTPAACDPIWQGTKLSGSAYENGAFVLRYADGSPDLGQSPVTGDFVATFTFQGFDGEALLFGADVVAGGSAMAAFVTPTTVSVDAGGTEVEEPLSGVRAGTLRFKRQGTTGTVTLTSSGTEVTRSGEISDGPLNVFVSLLGEGAVVRLTEFSATGGGLKADSFECDRLVK